MGPDDNDLIRDVPTIKPTIAIVDLQTGTLRETKMRSSSPVQSPNSPVGGKPPLRWRISPLSRRCSVSVLRRRRPSNPRRHPLAPQARVAPGQVVALYDGDSLVGGGIAT